MNFYTISCSFLYQHSLPNHQKLCFLFFTWGLQFCYFVTLDSYEHIKAVEPKKICMRKLILLAGCFAGQKSNSTSEFSSNSTWIVVLVQRPIVVVSECRDHESFIRCCNIVIQPILVAQRFPRLLGDNARNERLCKDQYISLSLYLCLPSFRGPNISSWSNISFIPISTSPRKLLWVFGNKYSPFTSRPSFNALTYELLLHCRTTVAAPCVNRITDSQFSFSLSILLPFPMEEFPKLTATR